MAININSFRYHQLECYQRRSLAPVRYVAITIYYFLKVEKYEKLFPICLQWQISLRSVLPVHHNESIASPMGSDQWAL